MAITPVNEVTLYGIADQKEAVLDGLQSLGCVHLMNLTPGTGEGRPAPGFSVEAHEALHYLRACPIQRRQVKDCTDFDFAEVMERVQRVVKTVEPHDSVDRYTQLQTS